MKVSLGVLLAGVYALTPRELFTKLVALYKAGERPGWRSVIEAYKQGQVLAFEPHDGFGFGSLKVQQVVEFFLEKAPKEPALQKRVYTMKNYRGEEVILGPNDLLPKYGGVGAAYKPAAAAKEVLEGFMLGREDVYGLNLAEDEGTTVYESSKKGLIRMATSTKDELSGREKNIDALDLWVRAFGGYLPVADDAVSVRRTLESALSDLLEVREQVKESLAYLGPLMGKGLLTAGELAVLDGCRKMISSSGHLKGAELFGQVDTESKKEVYQAFSAAKADLDSAVAYLRANLRELDGHRKSGHVYTSHGEPLFALPCLAGEYDQWSDSFGPTSAVEDW